MMWLWCCLVACLLSPLLALPAVIEHWWQGGGGLACSVDYQQTLLGEAVAHLTGVWETEPLVAVAPGNNMALVR
eukprot:COSAG05_NODE_1439_length_4884_cov_11.725065_2_plen_74_part_00